MQRHPNRADRAMPSVPLNKRNPTRQPMKWRCDISWLEFSGHLPGDSQMNKRYDPHRASLAESLVRDLIVA